MSSSLSLDILVNTKAATANIAAAVSSWKRLLSRTAKDFSVATDSMFGGDAKHINGQIDKIRKSAKSTGNRKGGIMSDVLFGSLGASGIQAAIGGIGSAVKFMAGKVMSGAEQETATIAISSDIATNLNISLSEALAMQEEANIAIAEMAAALPGVTEDYNAIFLGIAPSVSKVFSTSSDEFQKNILEIVKRVGVLAAKSGADPVQGGSAINRFISGTSGFGELMRIDIFQKNAQFQEALRDQLAAIGKSTEDWKKLTDKQRLEITQRALKIATPDELLEAFEGTVEAYFQQAKTALVDPFMGAFGVLRKVDGESLISALGKTMGRWAHAIDLFNQSLAAAGLDRLLDPMRWMIKGIENLGQLADDTAKYLIQYGGGDAFDLVRNTIDVVREWFSSLKLGQMPVMASRVESFNKSLVEFVEEAMAGLRPAIVNTDWEHVGKVIGEYIILGLGGLGHFIATLDWAKVGDFLYQSILAGLIVLGSAFRTMGEHLAYGAKEIDRQLLASLGEFSRYLTDSTGSLLTPMGEGIKKVDNFFVEVFRGFFVMLKEAGEFWGYHLQRLVISVKSILKKADTALLNGFKMIATIIKNSTKVLIDQVRLTFEKLTTALKKIGGIAGLFSKGKSLRTFKIKPSNGESQQTKEEKKTAKDQARKELTNKTIKKTKEIGNNIKTPVQKAVDVVKKYTKPIVNTVNEMVQSPTGQMMIPGGSKVPLSKPAVPNEREKKKGNNVSMGETNISINAAHMSSSELEMTMSNVMANRLHSLQQKIL